MVGVRARQLSQRQRRVLVLTEYAGLFSYLTVTVFMDDTWWLVLAFVGVVAMVLIHSQLLVRFTQKIANNWTSARRPSATTPTVPPTRY
jgi:uncharacterized membrane protein